MVMADPTTPEPPLGPYPPAGPTYPAPYGPQPVYVVKPPTSPLAVTSLVLSIIGIVTGLCAYGIPSISAVIFGHFALRDIKHGSHSGFGMALAGLIMGYLVAAPWLIFGAMALFGHAITLLQH